MTRQVPLHHTGVATPHLVRILLLSSQRHHLHQPLPGCHPCATNRPTYFHVGVHSIDALLIYKEWLRSTDLFSWAQK
uniref:Uncharacterized protein n=1 Tax=Triticum urartu TaxID=4572 RepID=A0A8R7P634_TRIUA